MRVGTWQKDMAVIGDFAPRPGRRRRCFAPPSPSTPPPWGSASPTRTRRRSAPCSSAWRELSARPRRITKAEPPPLRRARPATALSCMTTGVIGRPKSPAGSWRSPWPGPRVLPAVARDPAALELPTTEPARPSAGNLKEEVSHEHPAPNRSSGNADDDRRGRHAGGRARPGRAVQDRPAHRQDRPARAGRHPDGAGHRHASSRRGTTRSPAARSSCSSPTPAATRPAPRPRRRS